MAEKPKAVAVDMSERQAPRIREFKEKKERTKPLGTLYKRVYNSYGTIDYYSTKKWIKAKSISNNGRNSFIFTFDGAQFIGAQFLRLRECLSYGKIAQHLEEFDMIYFEDNMLIVPFTQGIALKIDETNGKVMVFSVVTQLKPELCANRYRMMKEYELMRHTESKEEIKARIEQEEKERQARAEREEKIRVRKILKENVNEIIKNMKYGDRDKIDKLRKELDTEDNYRKEHPFRDTVFTPAWRKANACKVIDISKMVENKVYIAYNDCGTFFENMNGRGTGCLHGSVMIKLNKEMIYVNGTYWYGNPISGRAEVFKVNNVYLLYNQCGQVIAIEDMIM